MQLSNTNFGARPIYVSGDMLLTGSLAIYDTGSYQPTFQVITGSQVQIPSGVFSYSIAIESGFAYVNGNLFNAQVSINGGGYNVNYGLRNQINVGTTGGRVVIIYEN